MHGKIYSFMSFTLYFDMYNTVGLVCVFVFHLLMKDAHLQVMLQLPKPHYIIIIIIIIINITISLVVVLSDKQVNENI